MTIIKTIDLWTEQHANQHQCFNGAFVDGFENDKSPFDEYKIIQNCNCIITTDRKEININNKHQAIVFYQNKKPVRLMVVNKNTNIESCIGIALSQWFKNQKLSEVYKKMKIKSAVTDLREQPILKKIDSTKEVDVGSCDRWNLLYSMLKGSYTESSTPYGNYESDQYEFVPNIFIKYELTTDKEKFEIEHTCCFINILKNRIIPIQNNSPLTGNN